jgi:hypothetical protein
MHDLMMYLRHEPQARYSHVRGVFDIENLPGRVQLLF